MKKFVLLLFGILLFGEAYADDFLYDSIQYYADDFMYDSIQYRILNDKEVEVKRDRHRLRKPELQIPEKVNGFEVVGIGESAFENVRELVSIKLPKSIRFIKKFAFVNTGIREFELPECLTEISAYLFSDCDMLNSIRLPKGIKKIERGAFRNCRKIDHFDIPEGVDSIGDYAFTGTAITTIKLPSQLKYIPAGIVAGCKSLTSMTFPDEVPSIGDEAFAGCESLTHFEVPEGVRSIGERAFSGCTSLAHFEMPEDVLWIGQYAFSGCTAFTNFVVPDNVLRLGQGVFQNCISLENLQIGKKVRYIGPGCFEGCESLSTLAIPASVDSLPRYFNFNIWNLKSYSVDPENRYFKSVDNIIFDKEGTTIIAFPPKWREDEYVVPQNVHKIGELAFQHASISKITFHEEVDSIMFGAFRESSISSIEMPNSLKACDHWAFYQCENLRSISFNNRISSLGANLCYGCPLDSVSIPANIKEIGGGAFQFCPIRVVYNYSSAPQYLGLVFTTYGDLHVPKGCAELYRNHYISDNEHIFESLWSDFNIIDDLEGSSDATNPEESTEMCLPSLDTDCIESIHNLSGVTTHRLRPGINILRTKQGVNKKIVIDK